MGFGSFLAERDWTGLLAISWVLGFFGLMGWTIYVYNIELFREIVIALLAPTVLILKFYFDRQKLPQ